MLQYEHPASHQINLKDHLVRHPIDILRIDLQRPAHYPLWERDHIRVLIQRILVVFECRDICVGFSLTEGFECIFFLDVVERFIIF